MKPLAHPNAIKSHFEGMGSRPKLRIVNFLPANHFISVGAVMTTKFKLVRSCS
jgi:hypothetical protein